MRRFFQRRPWLTDSLLAGLYLLIASLLAIATAFAPGLTPVWIAIVLAAAGTAVVLFRRRRPVLMFALATVLALIGAATSTVAEMLLPLLAVYAVGVYRSTRAAWACFGVGMVGAALAAYLIGVRTRSGPYLLDPTQAPDSGDPFSDWVNSASALVILFLIGTLIGTNVGERKRYIAALVDRAGQLLRERDQQAVIASARERERIAREMHDIIAHSLSVMISLSEGAYAAAPDRPVQSRDAIGRVAETGRRTLGEVRRLLGAVRADDPTFSVEHAPQPGVAQLAQLAEEIRLAGLPVRMTLTGTPAADPALGLTVYRIVQESLTNALRHARGAREVVVLVAWADGAVEITVDDDAPSPPADLEPGRGILGIRERTALYGGVVEVGRREVGGWRVFVGLPWTGE